MMAIMQNNTKNSLVSYIAGKDIHNSDYTTWYKTRILDSYSSDIDNNKQEQAALFSSPISDNTTSTNSTDNNISELNNTEHSFSQLVYAGGITPEIQQIATDTNKGLRTTLNSLKDLWETVRLFKHPKGVLLDTIEQTIIKGQKTFTFIVFQANRKLESGSQDSTSNTTFDRFAFIGKVNSVRAVVEIERVEDRRCKASHIISTNNKSLMDIVSTSYLFNIHVHKGNPEGYAVTSLLKGLGFKIPPITIDSVRSDYLNSLIWFGDHKEEIHTLTQSDITANKSSMPTFSSRKNHYTRRLKKAVIR